MTILVTGASGQLGTDLVDVLEHRDVSHVTASRADADFTDTAAVRSLVLEIDPHAVVNCAAFHDVAGCEAEP